LFAALCGGGVKKRRIAQSTAAVRAKDAAHTNVYVPVSAHALKYEKSKFPNDAKSAAAKLKTDITFPICPASLFFCKSEKRPIV